MECTNTYDPTCNEPTELIEMEVCAFDGHYYEHFLMVKVSEVDEEPRYVCKQNLENYNNLIKQIAI